MLLAFHLSLRIWKSGLIRLSRWERDHLCTLVSCGMRRRAQLDQRAIQDDSVPEESTWGVLDIVPITSDFHMIHLFSRETLRSDHSSSQYPSTLFSQLPASRKHHDIAKREKTSSILYSSRHRDLEEPVIPTFFPKLWWIWPSRPHSVQVDD